MPDRYFELDPSVGLDPKGAPQPLVEVGVAILTYTVVDGEPVPIVGPSIKLTPYEGTRIVCTDDPRVATELLATHWSEIDKPTKAVIKRHHEMIRPGLADVGTHVSPEEAAAAAAPSDPEAAAASASQEG